MPRLTRCTCKMDKSNGCRYHREHNFDISSLEILARGRISPDLLHSPTKRHVVSPSNQQTSNFAFDSVSYKGQPKKAVNNMMTTYQKDFCHSEVGGNGVPVVQSGKSSA